MSARAEPLISFPRSYRPRRTLTARLESRRRDQNLTIEGHRWGYGSFRIQHRDFNAWNLLKRKGLMNFLKKIWVFHMGGGFDFCVWNCSLEKKIWRKDVGKVSSKKLVFFFFFFEKNRTWKVVHFFVAFQWFSLKLFIILFSLYLQIYL